MSVEAESCVRTHEQPRVRSGVGKPGFQERRYLRKRTVETVCPVKGCTSRAQAELAVAQRGGPGYDRSEINCGMQILPPQVHGGIPQAAAGCRARSRTGRAHEINRHTQIDSEVLGKCISNTGVEFVHLPGGVRGTTKLHVRSETGILRRRLSLRKSRCS